MLHPWTPVTLVMSQDSGPRVEVLVFEPTSLVVVSVLGPAMTVPTKPGWVRGCAEPGLLPLYLGER